MSGSEKKKAKMCDKVNPFAGLFVSTQDEPSSSSEHSSSDDSKGPPQSESPSGDLLAEVFGLTTNPYHSDSLKRYLVHVEAACVADAIFERFMLTDLKSHLVPRSETQNFTCDNHTLETEIIPYLFESFRRLQKKKQCSKIDDIRESFEKVVLNNVSTVLQVPDYFPGQEV